MRNGHRKNRTNPITGGVDHISNGKCFDSQLSGQEVMTSKKNKLARLFGGLAWQMA